MTLAIVSKSDSVFKDQLRPFLDDSAGGFVERLFEAVEESRNSRGNRDGGERIRKRDLKVDRVVAVLYAIARLRYRHKGELYVNCRFCLEIIVWN